MDRKLLEQLFYDGIMPREKKRASIWSGSFWGRFLML